MPYNKIRIRIITSSNIIVAKLIDSADKRSTGKTKKETSEAEEDDKKDAGRKIRWDEMTTGCELEVCNVRLIYGGSEVRVSEETEMIDYAAAKSHGTRDWSCSTVWVPWTGSVNRTLYIGGSERLVVDEGSLLVTNGLTVKHKAIRGGMNLRPMLVFDVKMSETKTPQE